jgi:hypothetical protein
MRQRNDGRCVYGSSGYYLDWGVGRAWSVGVLAETVILTPVLAGT